MVRILSRTPLSTKQGLWKIDQEEQAALVVVEGGGLAAEELLISTSQQLKSRIRAGFYFHIIYQNDLLQINFGYYDVVDGGILILLIKMKFLNFKIILVLTLLWQSEGYLFLMRAMKWRANGRSS